MLNREECEGVAALLRDEAGYGPVISPWELAADLGVRVETAAPGERSSISKQDGEWVARIDPTLPVKKQGTELGHECGHPIAARFGLPPDDETAWHIATAVLLPLDDFQRQLRELDDHVPSIVAANPHVSHALAARRIVTIRTSMVLRVIDVEPRVWRQLYTSPGWRWPRRRTRVEQLALEGALKHGEAEPFPGLRAWKVVEGAYVRLFSLGDGEAMLPFVSGR